MLCPPPPVMRCPLSCIVPDQHKTGKVRGRCPRTPARCEPGAARTRPPGAARRGGVLRTAKPTKSQCDRHKDRKVGSGQGVGFPGPYKMLNLKTSKKTPRMLPSLAFSRALKTSSPSMHLKYQKNVRTYYNSSFCNSWFCKSVCHMRRSENRNAKTSKVLRITFSLTSECLNPLSNISPGFKRPTG